jgi:hypothetical protein
MNPKIIDVNVLANLNLDCNNPAVASSTIRDRYQETEFNNYLYMYFAVNTLNNYAHYLFNANNSSPTTD